MENEKLESYVEYVKNFIMEKLPDFEGKSVYGCDLGYTLTENINVDGTATYNTREAMDYIGEWFDYAAEVFNYQVENYGSACQNPFENPEGWMVCMIIEGVNNILNQCDVLDEFWNECFELTNEIILKILDYVSTVEEIEF